MASAAATPEQDPGDDIQEQFYRTQREADHLAALIRDADDSDHGRTTANLPWVMMTVIGQNLAEARLVDCHRVRLDGGGYSPLRPVPEDCWRANQRLRPLRRKAGP